MQRRGRTNLNDFFVGPIFHRVLLNLNSTFVYSRQLLFHPLHKRFTLRLNQSLVDNFCTLDDPQTALFSKAGMAASTNTQRLTRTPSIRYFRLATLFQSFQPPSSPFPLYLFLVPLRSTLFLQFALVEYLQGPLKRLWLGGRYSREVHVGRERLRR